MITGSGFDWLGSWPDSLDKIEDTTPEKKKHTDYCEKASNRWEKYNAMQKK